MIVGKDITLSDDERLLLVNLITEKWVRIRGYDDFEREIAECESILRKLSGVDKRVYIQTVR